MQALLAEMKALFLPTDPNPELDDETALTWALAEIKRAREHDEATRWRDVDLEPPPLGRNLLFARNNDVWIGQALDFESQDPDREPGDMERVYLRGEDLLRLFSEIPTAWTHLPTPIDPNDPGLDPEF